MKNKREKTKKVRFWVTVLAISVFYVIAGAYLWYQNDIINEKNDLLKRAVNKIKIGEREMLRLRERSCKVEDSLNNRINLLWKNVLGNSYIDSSGVVFYEIDHIKFQYENPTQEQIVEWKERNSGKCRSYIQGKTKGYKISKEMMKNDPCVIYLIIKSKSLESPHEKQSWFDLYNLMNDEQIIKLYEILYRETYKLSEIDTKYIIEQERMERKQRNLEYQKQQKRQKPKEQESLKIPDFGDLKDEDIRFDYE